MPWQPLLPMQLSAAPKVSRPPAATEVGRITLHRVRVSSAAAGQPRRRQISKAARQILGAFWDTYIMSATREKLSTRALDM